MDTKTIQIVQSLLKESNIDGWLIYNFRNSNPFATKILGLPPTIMFTRRYFYFIPANGTPSKIIHSIEKHNFDSLPGEKVIYSSWQSLKQSLQNVLKNYKTVAMEYSPFCSIPSVSVVDGGTLEFVRKVGVTIVSSAILLQQLESTISEEQYKSHTEAAKHLRDIVDEVFRFIRINITEDHTINEYDVQQFIMNEFQTRGLITSCEPNCSVNANSANPHYEPTSQLSLDIKKGDFLLIDLWAKKNQPHSVYADITWTAFVGELVPDEYEKIFQIVKGARDSTYKTIQQTLQRKELIQGYKADDVARQYIAEHGYEKYFTHRTGHSLGEEVHGNGTHLDNYETHDIRYLIPKTIFTIEPGIYIPNHFGVRSEINVYISESYEAIITGLPVQECVVPILK